MSWNSLGRWHVLLGAVLPFCFHCAPPGPGNGAGDLGGTWKFTLSGDAATASDGTVTVRDRKAYLVANLKPEKAPFTSACVATTIRLDVEFELSGDGSAASVSKAFYLIEQQPSASPPCEALVMIPLYQSFGGLQVAPAITTHGGIGGRWGISSVNGFGAAVTCSVELSQGSLNVDCPGRAYKAELKVGPVRISGTDSDGVEIVAQR